MSLYVWPFAEMESIQAAANIFIIIQYSLLHKWMREKLDQRFFLPRSRSPNSCQIRCISIKLKLLSFLYRQKLPFQWIQCNRWTRGASCSKKLFFLQNQTCMNFTRTTLPIIPKPNSRLVLTPEKYIIFQKDALLICCFLHTNSANLISVDCETTRATAQLTSAQNSSLSSALRDVQWIGKICIPNSSVWQFVWRQNAAQWMWGECVAKFEPTNATNMCRGHSNIGWQSLLIWLFSKHVWFHSFVLNCT